MYAYCNQGTVSIIRCNYNDEANQKIQELLHHITIADGYDASQPEHREIWIVGFKVNEMVNDELVWFKNHKAGRSFIRVFKASEILFEHLIPFGWGTESLKQYFYNEWKRDSSYFMLYHMLDPEEYENLMAYLLREHPRAKDVTKEDYVLNMFVEHEKKRRASYK